MEDLYTAAIITESSTKGKRVKLFIEEKVCTIT